MSADLVVLETERRGIPTFRFNTEDYPVRVRLVAEPLWPDRARLISTEWEFRIGAARGIWLRRPRWPTVDPEMEELDRMFAQQEAVAAMGGVWRNLGQRCVSQADAMQAARWKLNQLAVANEVGMLVPETLVTNDPDEASAFGRQWPAVAKAVAEARVETPQETRIGETFELTSDFDGGAVRPAPVILQRRIWKTADMRVTVIGARIFAVRIVLPKEAPLDFRVSTPDECRFEVATLAESTSSRLLKYLDRFGLRFGAFDMAEDADGRLWFLECNPAGQWAWLEPRTGLDMTASLVDLLLDPIHRS